MTTGPLPTIVRNDFDLRLVLAGDRALVVNASFDYSAHEPFSVRATFRTSDGDVTWVFARDLLADGTREPVGNGDVAVWPSNSGLDSGTGSVVCIALNSPNGQALLEATRADIEAFLARTYTVVPAGSEAALIDLDSLIDRLLADGPAHS